VRDHQAEWAEWERRLSVITEAMSAFDTVEASTRQPGRSNVAPHLSISWDAERLGVSGAQLREQLEAGEPRIEMSVGEQHLTVNPYMMEEGEAELVAQRLNEIFSS